MKTIELKSVSENHVGGPVQFTTRDVIINCVDQASDGVSVQEMRNRFRILDALDAAGAGAAELQLEDADFETLKKCVHAMDGKWRIASRFIVEFCDQFK
jgi:hypothetical protein